MEELREALCVAKDNTDLHIAGLTPNHEILECCHGLIVCGDSDEESSDTFSDDETGNISSSEREFGSGTASESGNSGDDSGDEEDDDEEDEEEDEESDYSSDSDLSD